MIKVLEAEAKTVDEAVEFAVKRLGVSKEELQIEILDEGFQNAMGSRLARVRIVHDPKAQLLAAQPAPQKPAARDADDAEDNLEEADSDDDEFEDADADDEFDDDEVDDENFDEKNKPTKGMQAYADEACELVREILDRMGIDADVKANQKGQKIKLFIESEQGGLLIGKSGKNLDALQHIVNRILSKGRRNHSVIVLDTEGYRRKRLESLQDLAYRAAERVRDTGRRLLLQEMNPYDRRIIHLALKDDPDVQTESEGNGFIKRVMVFPARKRRR